MRIRVRMEKTQGEDEMSIFGSSFSGSKKTSKNGKHSWGYLVSKGCLEKSYSFRLMMAKVRAFNRVVPPLGKVAKKSFNITPLIYNMKIEPSAVVLGKNLRNPPFFFRKSCNYFLVLSICFLLLIRVPFTK